MQSSDTLAAETFGRDGAMFQELLGFMAEMSLVLWTAVLLSLVVRFVACHLVYRERPVRAVPDRAERIET